MKEVKKYTLCRTVTILEFCDVFANSQAEAKRFADTQWDKRRAKEQLTKWTILRRDK